MSNYIDIVEALHNYTSTEPTCLSFKKGDLLYVYAKDSSGWWDGTIGIKRGWFPSNYVRSIKEATAPQSQAHQQLDDLTKTLSQLLQEVDEDEEKPKDKPTMPHIQEKQLKLPIRKQSLNFMKQDEQELPPYWGRKTTTQGQVYYFNTQTNVTTYSLDEVLSDKPLPVLSKNAPRKSRTLSSSNWIPGPQSLLSVNTKVTWELLINNILRAISDLNHSAKNDQKPLYISQTNQVVRAIRDMLASSGLLSRESSTLIQQYKVLRSHHHNIMSSLSKLVLCSKVASGVWPPPDAVDKMRYQAGQVLLAIRHFVSLAQDLVSVDLKPISECQVDMFDIKGAELSDIEFLNRLDSSSDKIIESIAELVESTQQPDALQSVIGQARVVVTEIGQVLSLIEEIKVNNIMESLTNEIDQTNTPLLHDFRDKKELLYTTVNDLVTAARSTTDQFAPSNAIENLLEVTNQTLKAVKDLVMATKLVLDQEDLIEQRYLAQELETMNGKQSSKDRMRHTSDLGNLQRRAMSLTLLKQSPSQSTENLEAIPQQVNPVFEDVKNQNKTTSMPPSATFNSPKNRSSDESGQSGRYSKLEKLIGERVQGEMLKNREERPWVLNYDYSPESLSFNMEGQVNGGTLAALVERLTLHDQPGDNSYMTAFLMLYRQFTSSEQLLQELINRYLIEPPPNLNQEDLNLWHEKKQTPIRIRVFNVMKLWIENYWNLASSEVVEQDEHVLQKALNFSKNFLQASMPAFASRLIESIQRRITAPFNDSPHSPQCSLNSPSSIPSTLFPSSSRKKLFSNDDIVPSPILPKNSALYFGNLKVAIATNAIHASTLLVLDVDPLEIARQLTLMESHIYCNIGVRELLGQEWVKNKKNSCAVNVRKMSSLSTQITTWAVEVILSEIDVKRRSNILKQFIKIADRCFSLNNFASTMAITSALNSSTISRLKKTWEVLSAKSKQTFENLKKATDISKNYAVYRQRLKKTNPPCVPFLGLYLTDLTFIDDGNPNIRGKGLINFDKYYKASLIITEVQRFHISYALTEVVEISDFLKTVFELVSDRNIEDLYRISLLLEPREVTQSSPPPVTSSWVVTEEDQLENKLKQLEKVGFL